MSTHFGYAAYHCNVIMQSAIAHVADYHPLTLLQWFVSTVKQPEGYPDAIPLHIALQQPDWEKFVTQWKGNLNNTQSSNMGK